MIFVAVTTSTFVLVEVSVLIVLDSRGFVASANVVSEETSGSAVAKTLVELLWQSVNLSRLQAIAGG